jgi:hypothetical protein
MSYGVPRIEIESPAAEKFEVVVNWKGEIPTPKKPRRKSRPSRRKKSRRLTGTKKFPPPKNLKPSISRRFSTTRSRRFSAMNTARRARRSRRWHRPNRASAAGASRTPALTWTIPACARSRRKRRQNHFAGRNFICDAGESGAKNIIFTSQWDNYPREVSVPLAGKSSHAFLLMAGSTGALQSQFDNGEVIVTYADGTTARLR